MFFYHENRVQRFLFTFLVYSFLAQEFAGKEKRFNYHITQKYRFFRNSNAFKIGSFPHRAKSSFGDRRSVCTVFMVHPDQVTVFLSRKTVSM